MSFSGLTWHHAWWIPTVIVYYAGLAYLTKLSNDTVDSAVPWWKSWHVWGLYLYIAICPLWVVVSRVSRNILFDGMLYDNLLFLTYVTTMACLGAAHGFGPIQWLGVGLVVIGSIMMRIVSL